MTLRQSQYSRAGVTVAEFALILAFLITMIFGMIELTRLNNLTHAADSAAYEAARQVIVPGAKVSEASAAGKDALARAGISQATIVVTPSTLAELTNSVTVRVDVPLASNSWLPAVLTRGETVSQSLTLMTERAAGIPVATRSTPSSAGTPPPTPQSPPSGPPPVSPAATPPRIEI